MSGAPDPREALHEAVAQEAVLSADLRARVEAVGRQSGVTVVWRRPDRSAEREDLRARVGLEPARVGWLPSGRPWRGLGESGWLFRRARWGASIAFATSWRGLARGDGGAISLAEAVACFEHELAHWRRSFGAKPFYAAVAGVFRERVVESPLDGLALLAWENGAWRFIGRKTQPELSDLFFPGAPEKNAPPARWKGMSTFWERLLSLFQGRNRRAQARLAARSREFQDARREAERLGAECDRHAAAGDWSPEMLHVQRANAAEAARRAQLLHRQVAALQQNVQWLTTAKMGGALIADAKLPIDADRFEQLDRSHHQAQARREAVVEAEQALAETLLEPSAPAADHSLNSRRALLE